MEGDRCAGQGAGEAGDLGAMGCQLVSGRSCPLRLGEEIDEHGRPAASLGLRDQAEGILHQLHGIEMVETLAACRPSLRDTQCGANCQVNIVSVHAVGPGERPLLVSRGTQIFKAIGLEPTSGSLVKW